MGRHVASIGSLEIMGGLQAASIHSWVGLGTDPKLIISSKSKVKRKESCLKALPGMRLGSMDMASPQATNSFCSFPGLWFHPVTVTPISSPPSWNSLLQRGPSWPVFLKGLLLVRPVLVKTQPGAAGHLPNSCTRSLHNLH